MKKLAMTISIALLIALVASIAAAADKKITAEISGVTEAVTKNGVPYIRAIVLEDKTIDGESYQAGIPLMFFGDLYEAGRTLQPGDTVNVIARERTFQDRPSLTVLKVLQQ